jgi:hypothetical protein
MARANKSPVSSTFNLLQGNLVGIESVTTISLITDCSMRSMALPDKTDAYKKHVHW